MKASLRSILLGCASTVLMAIFSVGPASADGMRTSVSGAAATAAAGSTHLVIRIDAQAAQIIREWRIAHGLESTGIKALSAAFALSPQARTRNLLEQQCRNDGGKLSTSGAESDNAAVATRQEAVCV